MLMILLDAAAIMLIVFLVNKGEQMDFGPAAICGLAISLGSTAIAMLLGPAIGLFAVVPMAALAVGLIWVIAKIPLPQAAIAGAIFMVYKIGISFAFAAMFGDGVEA